jgi:hypothetical protein
MKQDYILKDNIWFSQKDNLNPDGTSNMKWSSKWKRFNQCFISSGSATYNQVCQRLLTKHNIKKKHVWIDEFAYLISIISFANGGGAVKDDNDKRFDWAFQTKFLNTITPPHLQKLGEWKNTSFDEEHFKASVRAGFQCVMGIWIKDYYANGNGHVISGIGWSENEKGVLEGIFVNDPAGNILSKKSYYADESGKEIFLNKSMFPKIFKNTRQIIYFEEK